MTNLQIQMMIHYYCRNEPYAYREMEHANSEEVKKQRQMLMDEGLIIEQPATESGYVVTDRGEAYVKFLQEIPLPEKKWIVSIKEL